MKIMAEVIEAHYIDFGRSDPDNTGHCICDEWVDGMGESWDEHLADALTAAGFGLVVDAKAEALAEAAKDGWDFMVEWSDKMHRIPHAGQFYAWLRNRAAAVKEGK